MRVVVHPADEGGCGAYRLTFPAGVLANEGADVHVRSTPYDAVFQPSPLGDRVIDLVNDVDADVVVLQRPLHRHRVELMAVLQRRGVAVVVEIDDDFHSLHRKNPAWRQTNPAIDRDRNRDWLMRACERADLVTCSTPALAERYAPHGRVVVLPNLVPAWYLTVDRQRIDERVVVGWSGSVHTHPGDLEVTDGQVAVAAEQTGAVVAVVGTGDGVQKALQLDVPPLASGWLPLAQYPQAVASFDVGIVPLALSPFNEAKSNLKMSEMAALGVPVVASPTSENRALHELGVGFVVHDDVGWWRATTMLCESDQLRAEMAEAGRAVMAARTYERQAWRWLEAWDRAAVNARARKVAA